jgi:hypothetical protein
VRILQGEGVAAMFDDDASEPADTQVPLSIAVEVRYEDGTLTKKVFASNDAAIGFLRERAGQ